MSSHSGGKKFFTNYLDKVEKTPVRRQKERLNDLPETFAEAKQGARKQLLGLGRSYLEIRGFRKISGIGSVGTHLFDAFTQTPYRFASKPHLFRYCRLGV